jgi:hypothetical protein
LTQPGATRHDLQGISMKTIFVFDDSRPTDVLHRIVAIGEDGRRIAHIQFDGWTMPFCRFAMGAVHVSDAADETAEAVSSTRARMLSAYDAVYGPGNWEVIWLDYPRQNEAWLDAMLQSRERDEREQDARVGQSSASLAKILAALFGAPEVQPHTTH